MQLNVCWFSTWVHFRVRVTAGYEGRRFPVVIGEVGSAFETTADKQWLQDFADFINAEVSERPEGFCGLITQ